MNIIKAFMLSAMWLCATSVSVQAAENTAEKPEDKDTGNKRIEIALEDFHQLDVWGNMKLLEIRISPDHRPALEVAGEDLEGLEVSVRRQKLFITQKSDHSAIRWWNNNKSSAKRIGKLVLYADSLSHIAISGMVALCCPDTLRGETFACYGKGMSSAQLTVDVSGQTELYVHGMSKAKISGKSPNSIMQADGQSSIQAQTMECSKANIRADGMSHIRLQVSQELKARANGMSEITYSGNPQTCELKTSGMSKIRKK